MNVTESMKQIERKLASLTNQTQYTPQGGSFSLLSLLIYGVLGLAATLQAQHTTFLALAARTATLDAELQKIKALYTQLWRAKTGSVRDPFNELDMDQSISSSTTLGLSGMQIR